MPAVNAVRKFQYTPVEQRSPEWFKIRSGIPTASSLWRLMAVGKRNGEPLKSQLDYLKELAFERKFHTSMQRYVTPAMQAGIDNEPFIAEEYAKTIPEMFVEECGTYYNKYFAATPDRHVGDIGIAEFKFLGDNSFLDVLTNGIPDKYWQQIQGQLFASKREWCDFVAMNANTRKFVVIRVYPDADYFAKLEERLLQGVELEEDFAFEQYLHDISTEFDFDAAVFEDAEQYAGF